jgi:hypothetical protein
MNRLIDLLQLKFKPWLLRAIFNSLEITIKGGCIPEMSVVDFPFGRALIFKNERAAAENWQPNSIGINAIDGKPGRICTFFMEPAETSVRRFGSTDTEVEIDQPDKIRNHLDSQFPVSLPDDSKTRVAAEGAESVFEVIVP